MMALIVIGTILGFIAGVVTTVILQDRHNTERNCGELKENISRYLEQENG